MNPNMKICKYCGAEIAKNAKICPYCGGKNPKPIYKRVWFWILILIILFFCIPTNGDPAAVEYTSVTVDELFEDLNDNPLNAEDKYMGAAVSVTGRLIVIDSDGEYIGISSVDDEYSLNDVLCYVTKDEQLEVIKDLSIGDTITVKGKISNVGEVFGYSMNIDSIEH